MTSFSTDGQERKDEGGKLANPNPNPNDVPIGAPSLHFVLKIFKCIFLQFALRVTHFPLYTKTYASRTTIKKNLEFGGICSKSHRVRCI